MKYSTQVYTSKKAYSSHKNLSPEEEKGIAESCFNNIPNSISTAFGKLTLYDAWDDFVPSVSNDWVVKSGWYVHKESGIKIKKEQTSSPDYFKENGNGESITTLTVKIPEGKGSNPKSHHNKQEIGEGKRIFLTSEQWKIAYKVGGNNYSKGVRMLVQAGISANTEDTEALFASLPIIGKAKLALQLLLEQHPKGQELAEAVLFDLEDLEIENLYQEALIDGDIKPKKGAWIA